ncbi:hypothetical protein Btru_006859 [Bulinus truncatus]|nr:hypothetical protein Btru_006859 [Bulinus truncatus]
MFFKVFFSQESVLTSAVMWSGVRCYRFKSQESGSGTFYTSALYVRISESELTLSHSLKWNKDGGLNDSNYDNGKTIYKTVVRTEQCKCSCHQIVQSSTTIEQPFDAQQVCQEKNSNDNYNDMRSMITKRRGIHPVLKVEIFLIMCSTVALVYAAILYYQDVRMVTEARGVLADYVADIDSAHRSARGVLVGASRLQAVKRHMNVTDSEAAYPAYVAGDYIMMNPRVCMGADVIYFVIVVHSAPGNLGRRERIRSSFARAEDFLPFHVRVAFLLGSSPNETLQRALLEEHTTHMDTVMGEFTDHVSNLTLKGVMGLRWVSQFCPGARFVLKIDDDVIVNTFRLLRSFYPMMDGKRRSLFCHRVEKSTSVIRREGERSLPRHVFPEHRTYPFTFCTGPAVIMTADLAPIMYQGSKVTPALETDDVYLFGVLPYVVGGVTYLDYGLGKNMTLIQSEAVHCFRVKGHLCPILVSLADDRVFWLLWKQIQDFHFKGNENRLHRRLIRHERKTIEYTEDVGNRTKTDF